MGRKITGILIRTIKATLAVIVEKAFVTFFYLKKSTFGRAPSGERLERIEKSPIYRHGKFQNLKHTTQLVEGYSVLDITIDWFVRKTQGPTNS